MTTQRCLDSPRSPKNNDEKHAQKFLQEMGVGSIEFEPNGNTAPDFLIAPSIAIEVTRLNQNFFTATGPTGLGDARFSIRKSFKNFLYKFSPRIQPALNEPSWSVGFCFRRPIEKWSSIEPVLENILNRFASGDRDERDFKVSKIFSISLAQDNKRHTSFFREGGCVDQNVGGCVLPLLKSNVRICLERKYRLLPVLSSYSERWLILVDHVSFGDWVPFEIDRTGWSRVILLSPGWEVRSYEPPQV